VLWTSKKFDAFLPNKIFGIEGFGFAVVLPAFARQTEKLPPPHLNSLS